MNVSLHLYPVTENNHDHWSDGRQANRNVGNSANVLQITPSPCLTWHFNLTSCTWLIISGLNAHAADWFRPACQHFSVIIHLADKRRFNLASVEIPMDVPNGFGEAPGYTVVTWCLNPSDVLNPAALSRRSQIPSAGASPFGFIILKESGNAGYELIGYVCVPGCTLADTQQIHTHTG